MKKKNQELRQRARGRILIVESAWYMRRAPEGSMLCWCFLHSHETKQKKFKNGKEWQERESLVHAAKLDFLAATFYPPIPVCIVEDE